MHYDIEALKRTIAGVPKLKNGRRQFSQRIKECIVAHIDQEKLNLADAELELGINASSLKRWQRQFRYAESGQNSNFERIEISDSIHDEKVYLKISNGMVLEGSINSVCEIVRRLHATAS